MRDESPFRSDCVRACSFGTPAGQVRLPFPPHTHEGKKGGVRGRGGEGRSLDSVQETGCARSRGHGEDRPGRGGLPGPSVVSLFVYKPLSWWHGVNVQGQPLHPGRAWACPFTLPGRTPPPPHLRFRFPRNQSLPHCHTLPRAVVRLPHDTIRRSVCDPCTSSSPSPLFFLLVVSTLRGRGAHSARLHRDRRTGVPAGCTAGFH